MATVTLRRKELADALRVATRMIPRRLNIPALGGVRLTVNGAVRLSATDLEYGAVLELTRAGGEGNADMLLPAARLSAQVRAGKGETVTLESGECFTARLDGTAAVVGMDPADFPTLPAGPEGELVAALDGAELVEVLRAVEFAVSGEIVRYALTGVLMEFEKNGGRVCLVASDGKRLARWCMKGAVRQDAQVIVPVKALDTVADLATRDKGLVKVYVEQVKATNAETGESTTPEDADVTRVHFQLPKAGVFTRVVPGNFPNHWAVTPADLTCAWTMDRAALTEAVEAILPATTDKTRAVRFTRKGAEVELFAKSADVGDARAMVPVDGPADEQCIVLNPEYVLDYLKALPRRVERVTMKLKSKDCATLWHGPKGHDYVMMPLTVNL